jgi:hypothetical protein
MNNPLNTNWILWYHSIDDKTWTKSSYKEIYRVEDLYDLYMMHSVVKKHHLQNGMFFLMRDGIFPTWEDPDNREGCCASYKVPGKILSEEWENIVNRVLTEDILKIRDNWNILNGVSIAPKREFNIVKLWFRETVEAQNELVKEYEPVYTYDKSIIRPHDISK